MADVSINLSEEGKRFKKLYYPKGGEFGQISKLMNDLFIEHCKKRETIEFYEDEITEANLIIEQQNKRIEESKMRIDLIKDKENKKLESIWNFMKEKRKDMSEFILKTIELSQNSHECFDFEARTRLFNETFKQKISSSYLIKLTNFVMEIEKL